MRVTKMARMVRMMSERVDRASEQEQAVDGMQKKNPAFEPDLWSIASLTLCINLIHNDCVCRAALYVRCVATRYSLPWRWRRPMATYRGTSSMADENVSELSSGAPKPREFREGRTPCCGVVLTRKKEKRIKRRRKKIFLRAPWIWSWGWKPCKISS